MGKEVAGPPGAAQQAGGIDGTPLEMLMSRSISSQRLPGKGSRLLVEPFFKLSALLSHRVTKVSSSLSNPRGEDADGLSLERNSTARKPVTFRGDAARSPVTTQDFNAALKLSIIPLTLAVC